MNTKVEPNENTLALAKSLADMVEHGCATRQSIVEAMTLAYQAGAVEGALNVCEKIVAAAGTKA